MHTLPSPLNILQKMAALLSLCAALVVTAIPTGAHADDYSDVNRLVTARKLGEALAKAGKPRDPQMRFIKGVIHNDMGQSAEAMAIFRQLNQDYPELPEPYNNLAVLYAGQGDLDKARIALEMAIRTNPSYAAAHENLGDVLLQLASQSYAKALQHEPRNASVPNKLALIRNLLSPPPARSQPNRQPLTNTTPASSSPVTPASPAAKP
jgi:tetratricopeptide (TPR) repeat protein